VATYVAVAIDVVVALASIALSRVTSHTPADEPDFAVDDVLPRRLIPRGTWPVYVTIGLSGATALAAEAIWTRNLSLLLGATTYTFSIILAAFLFGLGIGSSVGASIGRTSKNPRLALATSQAMLALAIAWSANAALKQLPYWPINPGLASTP